MFYLHSHLIGHLVQLSSPTHTRLPVRGLESKNIADPGCYEEMRCCSAPYVTKCANAFRDPSHATKRKVAETTGGDERDTLGYVNAPQERNT
jgi:hypothetical protein